MGYAEADEGLPGISICPRCGARLVTGTCGTRVAPSPSKACFPGQIQPYLILLECMLPCSMLSATCRSSRRRRD